MDLGNEKAMYNIGFSYMGGECATQEDAEAMKWLSKAADRGYADAMPAIGNMIVLGRGAKRDFAEAVRWFRKGGRSWQRRSAVQPGADDRARNRNKKKDMKEAIRWYRKSAAQGYQSAIDRFKELKAK